MRLLLVLGLVVGIGPLSACKRDEAPPPDPTLEKLKAEADRQAKGGAITRSPTEPEDPNARLAAIAAGTDTPDAQVGPLALPKDGTTGEVEGMKVALTGASTAHQVAGGKLTLSTEDLFLTVKAKVTNPSQVKRLLSLEQAKVISGDETWKVARDAQTLSGTRLLAFEIPPGDSAEISLVFEVPPSVLAKDDLVVTLPQPEGGKGDVRLRLK